jgi:hypothetical protein
VIPASGSFAHTRRPARPGGRGVGECGLGAPQPGGQRPRRQHRSPRARYAVVWFDEDIEPAYAHLSVYNAQGTRVDRLTRNTCRALAARARAGIAAPAAAAPAAMWWSGASRWRRPPGRRGLRLVGVAPDTAAAFAAGPGNPATDHGSFVSARWRRGLSGAVAAGGPSGAAERLAVGGCPPPTPKWRWLEVLADILVGASTGILGALYVRPAPPA